MRIKIVPEGILVQAVINVQVDQVSGRVILRTQPDCVLHICRTLTLRLSNMTRQKAKVCKRHLPSTPRYRSMSWSNGETSSGVSV